MKNPFLLQPVKDVSLTGFEQLSAASIRDYFEKNKKRFENTMPKFELEFYTDAYWERQQNLYVEERLSDRAVRFCLAKGETMIGHMNFTHIVRGGFQACFLGYGIDEDYQGKNIMFDGLSQAIDFMFEEKKLHRIMANFVPENKRSEALLMRLGFQKEGFAKSYLRLNGRWQDHVMTSLINPIEAL